MACFQLAGIDPSFMDLFISVARGVASASAPSLRSRAGILCNPVDLLLCNFLSSLAAKDSLT